jgi:VIT1/CCC1 family predicted Fe2+/Mn2+ transporter
VTARREHHHRDVTGGWLRAAVFGVLDGLVSNSLLVVGVAAGSDATGAVVLAGLAGLVSGAVSMASGEYISVRSQNEATAAEIDLERRELARAPKAETAELAAIYRNRGVDAHVAQEVARQLSRDPEVALRVHVQEELGVDLDNLPSPFTAAGSSFGAFSVGALIPVLPYLLGATSLWLTLVVTAVGLFLAGAIISGITRRSPAYFGLLILGIGMAAAAVSYGVGSLVGAGVS